MTEWLRLHIVPAEAWSLSPSPHTAGSQLPITPPLQDLTVSSGLCENLHSWAYIYTQSHTYSMNIIKTKMHNFFFCQRQLDIPVISAMGRQSQIGLLAQWMSFSMRDIVSERWIAFSSGFHNTACTRSPPNAYTQKKNEMHFSAIK